MRSPSLATTGAALLLILRASASAVTMDWTPVGNPGNPADTNGVGAVAYSYSIATYEITNAQYVEFLNAKAVSDPLGLYNANMASTPFGARGSGIIRSGSSGSYTYSAIAGREDMPVNYVSFYDAVRFANWMNNGQGSGDTETGAYTLLGGTPVPSNPYTVTRSAGASIVLPSENEWHKAAYYDVLDTCVGDYCDYPARSDAQTTCSFPTSAPNSANCNFAVGDLTTKGSYTGSASPYGTFDQGGNVGEWTDTHLVNVADVQVGGVGYSIDSIFFSASERHNVFPSTEGFDLGFRLAMIPEPGTGLLVAMGLIGISVRRMRVV